MVKAHSFRRAAVSGFERHLAVIGRHRLALSGVQRLRNPAHLRVIATTIGISLKLPFQIACIQSRQPRGARPVSAAVETVTGEASVARAGLRTAQGYQAPVLGQPVEGGSLRRCASAKGSRKCDEKDAHRVATARSLRLFPLAVVALAACKPPPDQRQFTPIADAARGKAAIQRVGCGSCHTIPGVRWPQGKAGSELDGVSERALIAGKLPNRPDVLAAYIRNAPAFVPNSGMPAMPVSEAEAADIAAYLYDQGAR